MKLINSKKYILILIVLNLAMVSCKKGVLDVKDPNRIPELDFYTSEADALFGLYGIYDAYQNANLFGQQMSNIDQISDNLSNNSSSDGFRAFQLSAQDPFTNPRVDGFYLNGYNVINRANYVIKRVTDMTDTQISVSARKRVLAEASFLRSYAYFLLVNLYRDIPYYTDPVTINSVPLGPTKGTVIYQNILTELTAAIPDLPIEIAGNEKGRSGRAAAITLLGMIHLYKKDFPNALETLKPLLSAPYSFDLYPSYVNLFTPAGEFSKESIFEINFDGSPNDQAATFSDQIDTTLTPFKPRNNLTPAARLVDSYLCTDGKPIANSTLYGAKSPLYNATGINKFLNRDPRLRGTILTAADLLKSGAKLWLFNNATNYGIRKYIEITTAKYARNPQNFYVFRYADVLLMVAEAQNEVTGPNTLVYDCVSKVRKRVSMPDYPAGLTQDQMRLMIRDERRWEFAVEWQRYFDLKRWGIIQDAIAASGVAEKVFTNPRDYVWPIPQTELDRNPNMVQAAEWLK